MSKKISVAILGSTGYVGVELVKILSKHPDVEIVFLGTEQSPNISIQEFEPSIDISHIPNTQLNRDFDYNTADTVFLALPHSVSNEYVNLFYNKIIMLHWIFDLDLTLYQLPIGESFDYTRLRNDTQLNEVDCYGNPVWFFGEYLKNHFNNEIGWTNPLNLTSMGQSNMGTMQEGSCYGATQDQYQGFVWVKSLTASTPGEKRVSVCTCFEKPCSLINNRLENYISF